MSLPVETLPESLPVTTFANDAAYGELVIVSDVAFTARCDCHGLPYSGVATVGYLPDDRILGLSTVARLVEHCASEGEKPVQLAGAVADALERALPTAGVGVLVDARPGCGDALIGGAHQTTIATRGRLREHSAGRSEFLVRARSRRRHT